MSRPGGPGTTLVDAHVHLHDCFALDPFLEAAWSNLVGAAGPYMDPAWGVLCLTDVAGADGFARVRRRVGREAGSPQATSHWTVRATREETCLRATRDGGGRLLVVAGRQVRTREGLEVLALGTMDAFPDGRPVAAALEGVAGAGALPVIPWGFGKWMGARGRLLRRLLADPGLPAFFLGDNANRPGLVPRSPIFDLAASRGILDLPGSDPLPFSRSQRSVGRAGFVLEAPPDPGAPVRDLKSRLLSGERPVRTFVRTEGPLRFVRNQVAMRLRR